MWSDCIMFFSCNAILRQPVMSWQFFQFAKTEKAVLLLYHCFLLVAEHFTRHHATASFHYLYIIWNCGSWEGLLVHFFSLGFSPSPSVPCLAIQSRAIQYNMKIHVKGRWQLVAWELWRTKTATVALQYCAQIRKRYPFLGWMQNTYLRGWR